MKKGEKDERNDGIRNKEGGKESEKTIRERGMMAAER